MSGRARESVHTPERMKILYRGFEIDAHREKCMAGYPLLYFYIMRKADGFFLEDSFTEGSDTAREYISYMKKRVDAYIAHPSEEEQGGWEFGDPIDCPYCGHEHRMKVINIDAPRIERRSTKIIIEGVYMALHCKKCKHIATHLGTWEMNDHGRAAKNFYPCICKNCTAPRTEKKLA